MIGYETDEIIEERFKFLLQKYQEGLKEKMKKKNYGSVDLCVKSFKKLV